MLTYAAPQHIQLDEGPALAQDNASYSSAVYAHLHLDTDEALDESVAAYNN